MEFIILDTSSILFSLSNKVSPFDKLSEEFPNTQIIISKGIINELNGIGKANRKESKDARLALSLIHKANPLIEENSTYPDEWIKEEALARKCPVCTNDIKLKKVLRLNGIKTYSINRKGQLR